MNILSHRGLWVEQAKKNKAESFIDSFEHGFGIETDLRDNDGTIVISHDLPQGNEMTFEELLHIYKRCNNSLTLALNIKSDGLQSLAVGLLKKYLVSEYFFFDMSVPDTIGYINTGLKYFTRNSEIEDSPTLLEKSDGVWMDMFFSDWIDESAVSPYLAIGKKVCIVSPELHGRDYKDFWNSMRQFSCFNSQNLFICTDKPLEAQEYFYVTK